MNPNQKRPPKTASRATWSKWIYKNPTEIYTAPNGRITIDDVVGALEHIEAASLFTINWARDFQLSYLLKVEGNRALITRMCDKISVYHPQLVTDDIFSWLSYSRKQELFKTTTKFDHLFEQYMVEFFSWGQFVRARGEVFLDLLVKHDKYFSWTQDEIVMVFRSWPELLMRHQDLKIKKELINSCLEQIRWARPEIDTYYLLLA